MFGRTSISWSNDHRHNHRQVVDTRYYRELYHWRQRFPDVNDLHLCDYRCTTLRRVFELVRSQEKDCIGWGVCHHWMDAHLPIFKWRSWVRNRMFIARFGHRRNQFNRASIHWRDFTITHKRYDTWTSFKNDTNPSTVILKFSPPKNFIEKAYKLFYSYTHIFEKKKLKHIKKHS